MKYGSNTDESFMCNGDVGTLSLKSELHSSGHQVIIVSAIGVQSVFHPWLH